MKSYQNIKNLTIMFYIAKRCFYIYIKKCIVRVFFYLKNNEKVVNENYKNFKMCFSNSL